MAFNYRKLRGRIREIFGTQEEFAKSMNLSTTSISAKLNNKIEWSQQEINRAAEVLNIPDNKVFTYFFTEEV